VPRLRMAGISACVGLLVLIFAPGASALTFKPTAGSPILLTSKAPGGQTNAGLVTGDFNGDSEPDLAASWAGPGPGNVVGSYVSVLLGNGAGGFTAAPGSPILITAGASDPAGALAVGNFDSGHNLDLAVVSGSGSGNVPGTVSILLGNGDGSFTSAGAPTAVGTHPTSIAVGDFNGDGSDDLAVTNVDSGSVSILLGNGTGGLTPSAPLTSAGGCPQAVTTGYFNGDRHLDLAVANDGCGEDGGDGGYGYGYGSYGDLYVLLGNGSGGFTPTSGSPLAVSGNFTSIVSGDVNGDTKADLALAPGPGGSVPVLLGNGTGGFAPASGTTARSYSPAALAIGDLNGDGHLDLAAAGDINDPHYPTNGVVQAMLGDGTGAFAPVPDSPFAVGAQPNATPTQVVMGDFSKDGRNDLAVLSAGCQCTGPNVTAEWGPSVTVLLGKPGNSSVPSASLTASPNPALTADAVALDASASYGGSANDPIVDYRWDLGDGSFSVDTGSSPRDITTFAKPGLVEMRVKLTNATGATDVASFQVDVRPAPPPGDVGLTINRGHFATNSPHVVLNVVWPAYATQALLSSDGAFDAMGDTQTVPLTATIPWTLSSAGSGRHHESVHLRFPDSSSTQTFSDGIVLDTNIPTVQGARLVHPRGASDVGARRPRRRTFRVHILAAERVSGISAAQLATGLGKQAKRATATFRGPRRRGILKLDRVVTVGMIRRPMYVRVRTAAGSWSDWRPIA
jgi:hypothetical protein